MSPTTITDVSGLWRPADVVRYLHDEFTEKTLTNWRCAKVGPPYVRISTRVYYLPESVKEWVKEQEQLGLKGVGVTHLLVPRITVADLPTTLRKRVTVAESGCYRASEGFHDRDGYAQYNGRYAHKVVWERFVGEVPDGHNIDHVRARGCIWRDCVNLAHLDCVLIAVNNLRSDSASSKNAHKDACDWGHEFDLINTRFLPDGRRECIACDPRRAELRRQRDAERRALRAQMSTRRVMENFSITRAAQTDVSDAWDALLDFGRAA